MFTDVSGMDIKDVAKAAYQRAGSYIGGARSKRIRNETKGQSECSENRDGKQL